MAKEDFLVQEVGNEQKNIITGGKRYCEECIGLAQNEVEWMRITHVRKYTKKQFKEYYDHLFLEDPSLYKKIDRMYK